MNQVIASAATSATGLHPVIASARASVNLPRVQELIRELAEYDLAVAIPHMHDENGALIPLPENRIAHEEDLVVSFPEKESGTIRPALSVMWRWSGNGASAAAECCGSCCLGVAV